MPIAELEKFRQKYPQYNDIDDISLATKLSQKYPQYNDILEKANATQPKESFSQGLLRNVKRAAQETAKEVYGEVISPVASGASTLAFGIPKAIAEKTGAKELIYPEQKTLPGKILRGGAETVGLLGGGALKAGVQVARLPFLAGESLLKKSLRGAVTGATSGLLQTPAEGEGILKPKERLGQAETWGALGAAFPIAGATLSKTGELVTKSGRWVAKNVGGITDATVKTIRELGADRVFDPLKNKADYIVQNLTPRVQAKITQAVDNFTPKIQKFVQEKLKIPESAVNTIKNSGVNAVNKIRQTYTDSTDVIAQKISQGFTGMRELADKTYQSVMDSAPEGKQINIRPAIEQAGNRLKRLGLITDRGNMTELGQSEISRDSVYGKLLDFYQSADAISGVGELRGKALTELQMIKAFGANRRTLVNKDQYTFLRDKLNSLYKNKPSDVDVSKVVNQFYQDGEVSGLKGIQAARAMQRKTFQAEAKFLDSNGNLKALGKEGSLDKFHKLTKDQVRQLKEIESFTGEKFVDDLDKLTASRYLDEFSKLDGKKIASDLIRAKNPNWTKYIKGDYEKILGNDFKNEFDDLMAHFANIDFELVSATPGTGGGISPSRYGLLRKGIAGAAKQYYKNIEPKTGAIKKEILSGITSGKKLIGIK
ncbi:MAG: hypothetical protein WC810_02925 [Janthinobacterium sp.]|jgi:hypothetical protein